MSIQFAHADDTRLVTKHLDVIRRRGFRDDSMKARRGCLQRLSRRLQKPLLEATRQDLDDWQAGLTVCLSSIQTYTCHVRAFYQWAHDAELVATNPADKLPVPVLPKRQPRPMPEDAVMAAWRCSTEPVKTWLALAGWSGLRRGEIARITRESIELAGPDGAFLNIDGKGGVQRIVPISPLVLKMLGRYTHNRGPIFRRTWSTGQPVKPDDIGYHCNKYLSELGLPYTLHTLRHRFATQMAGQTKDLRLVQELMGHANLGTTAGYIAIDVRQGAQAVTQLASTLDLAS